MIIPNVVLIVHTKDVSCTSLIPNDILLVIVQMKKKHFEIHFNLIFLSSQFELL